MYRELKLGDVVHLRSVLRKPVVAVAPNLEGDAREPAPHG